MTSKEHFRTCVVGGVSLTLRMRNTWFFYCLLACIITGFPGGSERVLLQCRRPRFNPWVKKIPWRRDWLPTPVILPGESHGQSSLVGRIVHGVSESGTTERPTLSFISHLGRAQPSLSYCSYGISASMEFLFTGEELLSLGPIYFLLHFHTCPLRNLAASPEASHQLGLD